MTSRRIRSAASTPHATAPLSGKPAPRTFEAPRGLTYRTMEWLWLLPTLFFAVYFAWQFAR